MARRIDDLSAQVDILKAELQAAQAASRPRH